MSSNWTSYSDVELPENLDEKRREEIEIQEATYRDGIFAGYYVIVVILVYSMSIVLLIASHITRKNQKLLEDRQIHNYLKEFQVVQERSSRDNYRNMKKTIVAKLGRGAVPGNCEKNSNRSRASSTRSIYRCFSKTIAPLAATISPDSTVSSHRRMMDSHQGTSGGRFKDEESKDSDCLCKLYVIDEIGPDLDSQERAKNATLMDISDGVSQKNVTAEINIPPRVPSVNQSDHPPIYIRPHQDSNEPNRNVDLPASDKFKIRRAKETLSRPHYIAQNTIVNNVNAKPSRRIIIAPYVTRKWFPIRQVDEHLVHISTV